VDKEGKNYIVVSISDTGCGMTDKEIESIFNPEYTTKKERIGLRHPFGLRNHPRPWRRYTGD